MRPKTNPCMIKSTKMQRQVKYGEITYISMKEACRKLKISDHNLRKFSKEKIPYCGELIQILSPKRISMSSHF